MQIYTAEVLTHKRDTPEWANEWMTDRLKDIQIHEGLWSFSPWKAYQTKKKEDCLLLRLRTAISNTQRVMDPAWDWTGLDYGSNSKKNQVRLRAPPEPDPTVDQQRFYLIFSVEGSCFLQGWNWGREYANSIVFVQSKCVKQIRLI